MLLLPLVRTLGNKWVWVAIAMMLALSAAPFLLLFSNVLQRLIGRGTLTLDALQGEVEIIDGVWYISSGSVVRVTLDLSRLINPAITELEVRSDEPGIEYADFTVISSVSSTSGQRVIRIVVDPEAPPRVLVATLGITKPMEGPKFEVTAFRIRGFRGKTVVLSEEPLRFVVVSENELQSKRQGVQIRYFTAGTIAVTTLAFVFALMLVRERKRKKGESEETTVIREFKKKKVV